jgi:hypothetical protein
MSYNVKLKDIDQDKHYILRIVELPGIIHGNYKISRYPMVLDELNIPLQEILVNENLTDILNAHNDKQTEDKLTRRLKKISRNRKFIIFINLRVDNPSLISNIANLSSIAKVINDVYYSHPSIALACPPNLIFESERDNIIQQIYINLLNQIASNTERKLVYFIPSYLSISQKEALIDWYRSKYGDEGLLAVDCSGGRFSSECYSYVATVHRKMRNEKIQDYGIYLFDSKPHKKTNKSSPSEELLSILHGVNLIGPLHSNTSIPPHVVEKLRQKEQSYVKVFTESTYLYEAKNGIDYVQAQIESDRGVNKVLQNDLLPKNVGPLLSQNTRTVFLNELMNLRKNFDRISLKGSLSSFFNI